MSVVERAEEALAKFNRNHDPRTGEFTSTAAPKYGRPSNLAEHEQSMPASKKMARLRELQSQAHAKGDTAKARSIYEEILFYAHQGIEKYNKNHSPKTGEFTSGSGGSANPKTGGKQLTAAQLATKKKRSESGPGKNTAAEHGGRVGVQSTLQTPGGRAMSNTEVGQTFERALLDKGSKRIAKALGVKGYGETYSSSGQGSNTPIDVLIGDAGKKGKFYAAEVKTYHMDAEGKVCMKASVLAAKKTASKKIGAKELTIVQIVDPVKKTVSVHYVEGYSGMRTKMRTPEFKYKYTDSDFAKWHKSAGYNEAGQAATASKFIKKDDYIEGGPPEDGDVVFDINSEGVEFFYVKGGKLTKDFPTDGTVQKASDWLRKHLPGKHDQRSHGRKGYSRKTGGYHIPGDPDEASMLGKENQCRAEYDFDDFTKYTDDDAQWFFKHEGFTPSKYGGLHGGGEAKAHVVTELGKSLRARYDKDPELKAYVDKELKKLEETESNYWGKQGMTKLESDWKYSMHGMPMPADHVHAFMQLQAQNALDAWAGSSNGGLGSHLQTATSEVFGLPLLPHQHRPSDYAKYAPMNTAIVKEMYKYTQSRLKEAGITEVTLIRGQSMHIPSKDFAQFEKITPQAYPEFDKRLYGSRAATYDMALQPLNSFSHQHNTSINNFSGVGYQGYGGGDHSSTGIMITTVPASRIIGSAVTGFGCLNEYEWIVLGGVQEHLVYAR